MSTIDSSKCPLCGKSNLCAMELEKLSGEKQAACWCTQVDFNADLLARVPTQAQGLACICAQCAQNRPIAESSSGLEKSV